MPPTPDTLPDAVREQLPASARLVYLTLAASEKPLMVEEVAEQTGFSLPQTRVALNTLCEYGFAEFDRLSSDKRRKVYSVAESTTREDTVTATP